MGAPLVLGLRCGGFVMSMLPASNGIFLVSFDFFCTEQSLYLVSCGHLFYRVGAEDRYHLD